MVNVNGKEKGIILKHFSCMTPFHDQIKNFYICTKGNSEIVCHSNCIIDNLRLHNLAFFNGSSLYFFTNRIQWDQNSIKYSKEFNFTTFLRNEYYTLGMIPEIANLISIYAGLST